MQALARIKTLLIEDDQIDQRAFLRAVREAWLPYDCQVASSIAEAQSLLQHEHFDIVVADYRLNDGTSLDILSDVKDTPVIIVTGVGDEEIAVRAMKAGVYDYLIKDTDRHYLTMLPMIVQAAMRRKSLEIQERDQRLLAETLRDTAAALNSTLELDKILKRILENVQRIIPHDSSSVMLIENGIARIAQCNGWPADTVPALMAAELPVEAVDHLKLMYHMQSFCIIADVSELNSWIRISGAYNPRSYLAAPICVNGAVIGFLNLDSMTPDYFTTIHVERLRAFVNQAAVALENARLYKQAQELAAIQERQRLARDLHDSVTQTLFAASVMSNAIIKQWQQDAASIGDELLELRDMTQGALSEMRTLLLELRPSALLEADLTDLLRQLTDTIRGRSRMSVRYITEGSALLLPDVHVALFRIAQESLNNVIKHARAKSVLVRLVRQPERVELVVQDDGRGFDADSGKVSNNHFGLSIMRERACEAHIELTINSQIGSGTEIRALWVSK